VEALTAAIRRCHRFATVHVHHDADGSPQDQASKHLSNGPLEDCAQQFDPLLSSLAQRRGLRDYLQGLLLL
jgi:hypothetical protein